jgi:hypothetical protein
MLGVELAEGDEGLGRLPIAPSGEPFCFAGLWPAGTRPTRARASPAARSSPPPPNELVQPIHHRMPAILCDPEAWEAWLDPALENEALPALLEPPTGSPPGPRTPHRTRRATKARTFLALAV